MADLTSTKARHMLIEWLRNLDRPNSPTETPKNLDADIVDITAIMRSLGMKLVSFERSGEVSSSGSHVVIESKLTGSKFVMEKTTSSCNCPAKDTESLWNISGVGSMGSLSEADSSALPKLSPELNRMLHEILIDVIHVIREVEMKPKKTHNYVIRSQENLHTAGFSPMDGVRHASSMPRLSNSPVTPKQKLTCPDSQRSSENNMAKSGSPINKLLIQLTQELRKCVDNTKEEVEKILSVLNPTPSTPVTPSKAISKSPVVRRVMIPTKKVSQGYEGAFGKGTASGIRRGEFSRPLTPYARKTVKVKAAETNADPAGGAMAANVTRPYYQTRQRSAAGPGTPRPPVLIPKSGADKGAIRKTPSIIPRIVARPRTQVPSSRTSAALSDVKEPIKKKA